MNKYLAWAFAFVVCFSAVASSEAAEFQVESKIFRGSNPNPAIQLQTVFLGQKVYDVVTTAPRQVTIIDFDAGVVTLYDPQRQVKVSMKTKTVLEFSTYFKTHGKFPSDPLWKFSKDPEFETTFDEQLHVLKMEGDPLSYEAELQKIDDPMVANDYARFCNWSAELNFICGASALPQARMELNSQIQQRSAVPREVRKTIRNTDPAKIVSARSTHNFQWKTDAQSIKLIEIIESDLLQAKSVTMEEFLKVK